METGRFGRYRIVGPLGSGAMGDVFAAVDDALGREVAIKTLRARGDGLAAHLLDARFRQEARAIAALVHPSIVQVFDIDLEADPPYLVMERVAGPSLKEQFLAGPLAAEDIRLLGIQIARALAAAHASGVIHRDVKPANILVAGAGAWKLADFGVAHVPDSSLTMSGQFVGTPAYAPPEALVQGVSSAAGDVFGLGATLYEAATGRWPRLDGTISALLAPVPPLRALAPAIPVALAATIDRAVALEPADRPTAAALADALTQPPAALPVATGAWRPWAIGAGVIASFAILASLVGHGGSPASPAAAPAAVLPPAPGPAPTPTPPPPPPPPGADDKQSKDWNKILDEAGKGHYEGARHKLDEFEDKYGQTVETRDLAAQLDALGPDVHEPHGEPHGKHKGPPGPPGPPGRHDD